MKNTLRYALGLSLVCSFIYADASSADRRLYIVGEALNYGYTLNCAQALLATPEMPDVYSGTIYLKGNEDFKFMENNDWGGTEYGVMTDNPIVGDITLSSGKNDEGYNKIKVSESGNYYMVIDTKNLSATIEKSAYQTTPIEYCSLFLVGSSTPGGWSVDEGTPLYQSKETPVVYSNNDVYLTSDGSFKIAKTIKGGGTFNADYWFFRDANDNEKISTDDTDDRQWSVPEDGNYAVNVNTLDNSISLKKASGDTTGIDDVISDTANDEGAIYYNLQGVRIEKPSSGIFLMKTHSGVKKIRL